MKEVIKEFINNPEKLEQLYHDDKNAFESGFEEVYSEIEKSELSKFWKIRLDYIKQPDKIRASLNDIFILIASCLVAGLLIKIPDIFKLPDNEIFYQKNIGLIVFFGLTLYNVLTNKIFDPKKILPLATIFFVLTIFVNLLPPFTNSSTINLVYIHLPILMWCIFGFVYINFDRHDKTKRIEYIRFNGDLAILMAIIVISGGILTGITIGLFQAIGINITDFYMKNVVIVGAVSAPIVATFITKYYTVLTNKIATIIANIFSPLVLLTAIVFLVALAFSGKNPYNDREFLLIFNLMLLGVMAVIVFSISEATSAGSKKFNDMVLFILSIVTAIIDLIAVSAIFYRLSAYGLSPNRLAVLGSNLLILGNLVLIVMDLYKVNFKKSLISDVEFTIAKYIPVYVIWILFVVIGFPLIFGLK